MSKPEGAAPVGVSNVDMKTDVWLVMHNGVGHEVVLVEDFNAMAKELAESRALLIKLRDSGDWFHSAIEFDCFGCSPHADGEALLKEVEALVGPRVPQ